jgi:hypothetical protein
MAMRTIKEVFSPGRFSPEEAFAAVRIAMGVAAAKPAKKTAAPSKGARKTANAKFPKKPQ